MNALTLLRGTSGHRMVDIWRGLANLSLVRQSAVARAQRMDPVADARACWKKRLDGLLAGSLDEHLEIARVAADRHCALGVWLHGAARRELTAFPEYHALLESHVDFHLMASDVVRAVYAGNKDRAQRLMGDFFHVHAERVWTSYSMVKAIRERSRYLQRLPDSDALICCV